MTRIQRRASRVSTTMCILAGLTLAACGGSDSSGPNGPDDGLSPGEGVAVSGTTPISLDGGSTGTENVLVLVDTGLTSISAKTNYTVTATGTGAAGAVSAPATALVPLTDAATSTAPNASAPVLDIGYGMRLNARNRSRFAGGIRGARAAFQAGTALPRGMSRSISVAAPAVGDLLTLNVGMGACSPLENRGTRIVAIGSQSIIVSDTLNPAGGFTTADFQRFAARFDTLVYPLDIANFGSPADMSK